MGGTVEVGIWGGTHHLCWIQALFLGSLQWSVSAWIYATEIENADSSRIIGTAAVLPKVSGKVSLCSGIAQKQPQSSAQHAGLNCR